MTDLPKGEPTEIVTFSITDRHGMNRGRGIADQKKAEARARSMVENLTAGAPFTIYRVTVVQFRYSEPVAKIE